jgi:transcriptional regulator with XRE-family HTH domain
MGKIYLINGHDEMARKALPSHEQRRIRERLQQYVEDRWEGDWEVFGTAVGIPRSTVLRWREDRRAVPDLAHLQRLAGRNLSLDWLLAGVGPMERRGASTGASPADQVRAALADEYLASERPQTVTLTDGTPVVLPAAQAPDWDMALPPAATLFRLVAEFIRPLAREAALIVADHRRGGRYSEDAEFVATAGMERVKAAEARKEAKYQTRLAEIHQQWAEYASHLSQRNREGRAGYQFVTDRPMLGPLQ